jgi:hypothetical protein
MSYDDGADPDRSYPTLGILVLYSGWFLTEARAFDRIDCIDSTTDCKLFFVRYIDPCWPKVAKLESDTIYAEVSPNITEVLESILILDISASRAEY